MHEAKVQRWDNNSLSAQIGGLMHDAVAIAIAEKKISKNNIVFWLRKLREIADAEKQPKQVNQEAIELGEEWQKTYNKECELAELKKQIDISRGGN